jgi:5-keto 4-deoxyuronate isomerase
MVLFPGLAGYLGPVRTVVVGEYRQMVAGGAAYHLQRGNVLYVGAGRLMVIIKSE